MTGEIRCPRCGEDITEFVNNEAQKQFEDGEFDDQINDHGADMAMAKQEAMS